MKQGKNGIPALIRALHHFEVVVEEQMLYHNLGTDGSTLTALDLCTAANKAGLRAKWYERIDGTLLTVPLPILICVNGEWSVIEKNRSRWILHSL